MESKENKEVPPEETASKEDAEKASTSQQELIKTIKDTMLAVLPEIMLGNKRPRSKENSPPDVGSNHGKDDDTLSLFARDSFNETPSKKSKSDTDSSRSEKTSSNHSSTGSNRKMINMGSNHEESRKAGFNRKTDVVSTHKDNDKENDKEEEDPEKLDMVEELLRQCEDDVQITDDYGPKIRSAIAARVTKYFTKGAAQSDARATIFKKYKLAENVSEIDAPKLNPGILNNKSGYTTYKFVNNNEKTLYNIQNNVTRTAMAVTNVITHAMKQEEKGEMMNPKDVTSTCLEAITLLGYVSKQLSNRRKDNLKSYINDDLRSLCDHDRKTTKFLLGDDLSKGARDAREIAKLSNKKSNNNRNNNSSNYRQSSSSYPSKQDYNSRKSQSNTSFNNSSNKSFLGKGQSGKKKQR